MTCFFVFIKIAPIIQEGHEALVHHFIIFACWGVDKEHLRNNNKTEGLCNTAEMPEFAENCESPLYCWAVGGGVRLHNLLFER